jgi:hypothetical protein
MGFETLKAWPIKPKTKPRDCIKPVGSAEHDKPASSGATARKNVTSGSGASSDTRLETYQMWLLLRQP